MTKEKLIIRDGVEQWLHLINKYNMSTKEALETITALSDIPIILFTHRSATSSGVCPLLLVVFTSTLKVSGKSIERDGIIVWASLLVLFYIDR